MQQCVRRGCPDQQVVNDQIAEKKVIDFTNENLGPCLFRKPGSGFICHPALYGRCLYGYGNARQCDNDDKKQRPQYVPEGPHG